MRSRSVSSFRVCAEAKDDGRTDGYVGCVTQCLNWLLPEGNGREIGSKRDFNPGLAANLFLPFFPMLNDRFPTAVPPVNAFFWRNKSRGQCAKGNPRSLGYSALVYKFALGSWRWWTSSKLACYYTRLDENLRGDEDGNTKKRMDEENTIKWRRAAVRYAQRDERAIWRPAKERGHLTCILNVTYCTCIKAKGRWHWSMWLVSISP